MNCAANLKFRKSIIPYIFRNNLQVIGQIYRITTFTDFYPANLIVNVNRFFAEVALWRFSVSRVGEHKEIFSEKKFRRIS